MSNYTKATNFAAKDSLASGNPAKIVKGTEIDTEFSNIETAVNSKADSADVALKANIASPTFTGTPLAPTAAASTDSTQIATTAFVKDVMETYNLNTATLQASTSGTSIDFTSIPSWVKRITVTLQGVSTNGTSTPMVQVGDSGGVETSGYSGSSGHVSNGGAPTIASLSTGFLLHGSWSAASTLHGQVVLTLMNSATNQWSFAFTGARSDAAVTASGAGTKSLSATLDRVRITTTSGSDAFDSGSINIHYE